MLWINGLNSNNLHTSNIQIYSYFKITKSELTPIKLYLNINFSIFQKEYIWLERVKSKSTSFSHLKKSTCTLKRVRLVSVTEQEFPHLIEQFAAFIIFIYNTLKSIAFRILVTYPITRLRSPRFTKEL